MSLTPHKASRYVISSTLACRNNTHDINKLNTTVLDTVFPLSHALTHSSLPTVKTRIERRLITHQHFCAISAAAVVINNSCRYQLAAVVIFPALLLI